MTSELFPIPAHFDLDIDRDDAWPLPEPHEFTPALSWWERVVRWRREVKEPLNVESRLEGRT